MLTKLKRVFGMPGIYPTREQIDSFFAEVSMTPDCGELEESAYAPLFVYDNMMEGLKDFSLIQPHIEDRWTAYTRDHFALVKERLGSNSYPVMLEKGLSSSYEVFPEQDNGNKKGVAEWEIIKKFRVRGQLVKIDSKRIKQLDIARQNGVQFDRKRIKVNIPFRTSGWSKQHGRGFLSEPMVAHVWAHAYVGRDEYWREQLESLYSDRFFACDVVTPNAMVNYNGDPDLYYMFSRKDYEP